MVVDLPDTVELVAFSFDDDLLEKPNKNTQDDPKEDLELGEHHVDHDIEYAKLGT